MASSGNSTIWATYTGTSSAFSGALNQNYYSMSTSASFANWTIPEALTEAQVIATRHILRLKELNSTELTEMADTIAEHCGVAPEIARSSLGVLKTLLTLGELQEKLER